MDRAAEFPASNVGVLYIGDWSAEDEPAPILRPSPFEPNRGLVIVGVEIHSPSRSV